MPSALLRSVALLGAASSLVGATFGAIAVAGGLPSWMPVLLSVLVFAGSAQFLFVGIVATGGDPLAAVLAGLLLNLRLVPLGMAVGDLLGPGRLRRAIGAHLLLDETAAFALAQDDPRNRRVAYWASAGALLVCWNVGVLVGVLGGAVVTDPAALGLDAAFPAVLLALVLPALRDPGTRRPALVGAGLATGTGVLLPAGVPVLVALTALLLPAWGRRPPAMPLGGKPR